MNPGLNASASGMRAQQTRIDAIANNLANVNTTAFKRSRTNFEDMLYETIQGSQLVESSGTDSLAPIQIGRGVRLAGVQRIQTQGTLEQTDNPFDLAIEGDGFFQIQLPNGATAYTRDGTFTRAADTGQLVTHDGYPLEPEITVPPEATQVTISSTGQVTATLGNNSQQVQLGQIQLVRFSNPSGLLSLGGNNYSATPASGDPMPGAPMEDGFGQIVQGSLETSNVEIVQEMVDMITAQRAYEVNSKAIQTGDEMIQTVTNDLIR
ncbi:MAG TPA: flagellar basal-body rod protein FlgG [Gemmatimonadales bacterium]|nr:flagellar basal-body rod protein FlgG [Gemmatimonadales bacterium]